MQTDPASEGRASSHSTRPSESTAAPPKRLDEPDTNSAVNGDFHAPYGVSDFVGAISAVAAARPDSAQPYKLRTTHLIVGATLRSVTQSPRTRLQLMRGDRCKAGRFFTWLGARSGGDDGAMAPSSSMASRLRGALFDMQERE